MDKSPKKTRILTLGYGNKLINNLWNPIAKETNLDIWHIIHPKYNDSKNDKKIKDLFKNKVIYITENIPKKLPQADFEYLENLDNISNFGIRNCINACPVLTKIEYSEALKFLSLMAKRIQEAIITINPEVIISGFEGFQSSLTNMIAKDLGINWYAVVYAPFPKGFVGFSNTLNNYGTRSFKSIEEKELEKISEKTLKDFYKKKIKTDIIDFTETNSISLLKFLPRRYRNLKKIIARYYKGFQNRYIHRSLLESIKSYLISRINQICQKFLNLHVHPNLEKNFYFYGIHMQPEMSMEVWAPFVSNQIFIIKTIAKALPPNTNFYVKLHPIDANSWNLKQLKQLSKIPSVKIVSHSANSRIFIEKSEIVFSIQGTIGYEAALLGRKVITFGKNMIEDFDNVYRVQDFNSLKTLILNVSKESFPSKKKIKEGLKKYIKRLYPGPHNNWENNPNKVQINEFASHLVCLINYLKKDEI